MIHKILFLFFAYLATLVFLSACSGTNYDIEQKDKKRGYAPSFRAQTLMPRPMRKELWSGTPTGDDSYANGFRDGCDTYSSIMGAGTFRLISVKIYPDKLLNDSWYLRGFRDASEFCTFRFDWETH